MSARGQYLQIYFQTYYMNLFIYRVKNLYKTFAKIALLKIEP